MKWRVALALLALAGCSRASYFDPPASLYRHYGDRLRVYLSPFLGLPCGQTWGQPRRDRLSLSQCFVYGQPQRMSGVLRIEGYGPANFYPGMTRPPSSSESWDRNWPAVSERYRLVEPLPTGTQQFRRLPTRAYRIIFTGRTTNRFAPNSHRRIVILDRIEKIERLAVRP